MNKYEHRKAEASVIVTDEQGNPLKNARLHVKLTDHKFMFGCGAFDVLAYVNCPEPEAKKLFSVRAEKWLDTFNYGTLPFYWGTYEPEEGNVQKENRAAAADYLRKHNVRLKGHPLCWHTVCADWLLKYDNETILKKQLERIERDVDAFKGSIDMWDVINETVIMPVFDKYDNAVTRICNHIGRIPLIKQVFEAAKKANPDAVLLLNDFNTSAAYEQVIEQCLDAGVPIDVIGIQSHQHQGYWGREKLEDVLQRFGRFGLPIHFTENTLLSGSLVPAHIQDLNDYHNDDWQSEPDGEERQKNQLEEMFRILFDTPSVEAVTMWDFSDGAWLNAPSGLLRRDGTSKPAYDMLKELIKNEWHTEYDVVTDEHGQAEVCGFKGSYTVEYGGKVGSFDIDGDNSQRRIIIR